MSKSLRKLLFFLFVIIFIGGAFYIIIAVQGLIINKDLSFIKTGGIYLNYTPQNAEVRINGVLKQGKSLMNSFLNSGIFVDNLLPGTYDVEVFYPQYQSWHKKLRVVPGFVVSKSFIHLWPKDWGAKKINSSSTLDFWLTGVGLILKTKEGLFYDNLKIKGDEVILSHEKRSQVITKGKDYYYLIDLNNISQTKSFVLKDDVLLNFSFHPFDQNAFLGVSKKAVYYFKFDDLKPRVLFNLEKDSRFYQNGNEIFIGNKNGKFKIADLFLKTQMELNITESLLKNQTSSQAEKILNTTSSFKIAQFKTTQDGKKIILLTEDGNLYIYERSSQNLFLISKLSSNVKDFIPSSDGTRIAILFKDKNSILIEAIKDFNLDGFVKKGATWEVETKLLPEEFLWLDSYINYGIYISSSKAFITDLDKEKPQNENLLVEDFEKIKIYGNNIYFVKEGSLYSLSLESK